LTWYTRNPQVYRRSQWDTSHEAPTINEDSTPLSVMLFFMEIIQLLVVQTNRYYYQYLDSLDDGWSPLPDMTLQEMYSFLVLILQMGHDVSDTLKVYWTKAEQFSMAFVGKIKQDKFCHICRYLHFTDNRDEPDMRDENFYRLWKMITIVNKLSDSYSKYYSPTEHLAVDKIAVLFKGRVVFKQFIPKEHKNTLE
jgi:hypothetical protein